MEGVSLTIMGSGERRKRSPSRQRILELFEIKFGLFQQYI